MNGLSILAGCLMLLVAAGPAEAQVGYTYSPPSLYRRPPAYGYGYGAYYRGYSPPVSGYASEHHRLGRPLPPYGFGSPYYSGYNDPYFYRYGPGVQQFLYFGGADFYGW